LKCAHQCAAGTRNFVHAGHTLLDDRELIAAQTGGETTELSCLAQPLRDPLQHEITEGMTHAVIDVLEIVEIEENTPTWVPSRAAFLSEMFR